MPSGGPDCGRYASSCTRFLSAPSFHPFLRPGNIARVTPPNRDFALNARQKSSAALAFALIVALAGCRSAPAPAPAPAPRPAPEPVVERYVDKAWIREMLDDAERSYANGWLDVPEFSSAARLYRNVLEVDPTNQEARRGLERIVERFVADALDAAERGLTGEARAQLDRARAVDPHHPAIEPTARQIELLAGARRARLTLNRTELAERNPALGDSIARFATDAIADGCRATISARGDAEGRWIYQQLSRGTRARVRATFQIASPPGVEVMCFD
jgi:hypothetical protein